MNPHFYPLHDPLQFRFKSYERSLGPLAECGRPVRFGLRHSPAAFNPLIHSSIHPPLQKSPSPVAVPPPVFCFLHPQKPSPFPPSPKSFHPVFSQTHTSAATARAGCPPPRCVFRSPPLLRPPEDIRPDAPARTTCRTLFVLPVRPGPRSAPSRSPASTAHKPRCSRAHSRQSQTTRR